MLLKSVIPLLCLTFVGSAFADTLATRQEIGPCVNEIRASNGRTADYAAGNIQSFYGLPPSPTRDNAIAEMKRQSESIRNEDPYAFQQPLPDDKETLRSFLANASPPEPTRCLMMSRLRLLQVADTQKRDEEKRRQAPSEKRDGFASDSTKNCNANTPVTNDVCISLNRAALQQCKGAGRVFNTEVLFQACEQFDGSGMCVSAKYICRGLGSDRKKRSDVQMLGVRG